MPSVVQVEFKAPSIDKVSGLTVLLPDMQRRGPFPTLYLLHGLSDDHTVWTRRTALERYLDETDLVVVMPDGHRSFYANDPRPGGLAYEDHIVKDVVGFVEQTFPVIPDRAHRAIAGLSMGGYGAIMLALRNRGMFSVAASHSGALGYSHYQREWDAAPSDVDALARALQGEGYDCFELAGQMAREGQDVALQIDCGTEDFLLQHNRDFHAHLEKLGVEHLYKEHPGAHSWGYWDEHIQQTLSFVLEHVGA
ncbi:MAG: alpha/beta hydrolase [Planctomycetota bacterium]